MAGAGFTHKLKVVGHARGPEYQIPDDRVWRGSGGMRRESHSEAIHNSGRLDWGPTRASASIAVRADGVVMEAEAESNQTGASDPLGGATEAVVRADVYAELRSTKSTAQRVKLTVTESLKAEMPYEWVSQPLSHVTVIEDATSYDAARGTLKRRAKNKPRSFVSHVVSVPPRRTLEVQLGQFELFVRTAPDQKHRVSKGHARYELSVAAAPAGRLSGIEWCREFPDAGSIDELEEPFRSNVRAFLDSLAKDGVPAPVIDSTRRPLNRAKLMHWAYKVALGKVDPRRVPTLDGIDIDWWHWDLGWPTDYCLEYSRWAAGQMIGPAPGYEIVYQPSLTSNHVRGLAIDMFVQIPADVKTLTDADGATHQVARGDRGNYNPTLMKVAKSFGVIKKADDQPHWSINGR